MDIAHLILLFLAIGVIAFLYSCVGHAGASGYIAVMTLFGLVTTTIRPTALVLNILVAIIASFQFWRAGHFSWKLFWPFALLSVPAAYFGGYLQLPAGILKITIGLVLLFSAARLFFRRGDPAVAPPPLPAALAVGSGIGFLSGLTGTGGGIFLTPLLLFSKWAKTKQASAVSALFILVNSIAGLAGFVSARQSIPALAVILSAAAIIGGAIGSHLGSRKFPVRTISILLATVLVIAGVKLIFTR
ncbi:MAG: hypothetical protein DMF19_07450 [Verrucomicrobia bacterium]|nr:MAG: hypothetical protein DMF19_07450 [Verrucomicrobiota bacterium]